jgi:hypothetical protein
MERGRGKALANIHCRRTTSREQLVYLPSLNITCIEVNPQGVEIEYAFLVGPITKGLEFV